MYVASGGPFSELNEEEGIEIPVWYVAIVDDEGDVVEDYGSFYDYDDAIIYADNLARERHLEHISEANID